MSPHARPANPRPTAATAGLHLTVAHKLLLLICIPLAFQLGFVGLFVKMQRDNDAARQWSQRAEEITSSAYALLDLLVEADSDLRTGIITHEAPHLVLHYFLL